jgi:hypothetical protein
MSAAFLIVIALIAIVGVLSFLTLGSAPFTRPTKKYPDFYAPVNNKKSTDSTRGQWKTLYNTKDKIKLTKNTVVVTKPKVLVAVKTTTKTTTKSKK